MAAIGICKPPTAYKDDRWCAVHYHWWTTSAKMLQRSLSKNYSAAARKKILNFATAWGVLAVVVQWPTARCLNKTRRTSPSTTLILFLFPFLTSSSSFRLNSHDRSKKGQFRRSGNPNLYRQRPPVKAVSDVPMLPGKAMGLKYDKTEIVRAC